MRRGRSICGCDFSAFIELPSFDHSVEQAFLRQGARQCSHCDPLSHATLLNDNRERHSNSVARIIMGCECFLMRAEWRTSLDSSLECYASVCCRDRSRRSLGDAHCWIRWSDRHITGESSYAVYVYCYTNRCPLLRCHC